MGRRRSVGPRPGPLQLATESEERRFVPVSPADQRSDREPAVREVKREGHRGLAGDVRDRIPRIELAIEPPPLLRAALGAIQDAEPLRWTSLLLIRKACRLTGMNGRAALVCCLLFLLVRSFFRLRCLET